VIERVNRTSALWQEFGFLCDLLVIEPHGQARYYEEVPIDYVHESDTGDANYYVTITLEYGRDHDKIDPFDITLGRVAQDDAERSYDARYLHPVLRQYSRRKLIAEHHIAENLENEWNGPAHREPLEAFFGSAGKDKFNAATPLSESGASDRIAIATQSGD
jgi:hypothetical protein